MQGMSSERSVRRSIRRSASRTVELSNRWFARITDVPSLLPLYAEAIDRPFERFGFDNLVQHRLSYAFVLAATGHHLDAREQLDRWCDTHLRDLTEDRASRTSAELHERLEQVEL